MDGSPLRSFEGRKHPAALPMSDIGRASEVCLGGEYASVLVRRRTKTRPPLLHHAAAKRSWRRWRRWRGRLDRRRDGHRRRRPLNGRETDSIADSLEVTLDIAPRSWFLLSLPSLVWQPSWPRMAGASAKQDSRNPPPSILPERTSIFPLQAMCRCASALMASIINAIFHFGLQESEAEERMNGPFIAAILCS